MIDMTNEIFYMEQAFLKSVKFVKEETNLSTNITVTSYIKEFNTLELRLPRRCGKTKYIQTFRENHSAMVFVANQQIANSQYSNNAMSIEGMTVGKFRQIDFVYLDEVGSEQFLHTIVDKGMHNILTYDTVIVSLLTK